MSGAREYLNKIRNCDFITIDKLLTLISKHNLDVSYRDAAEILHGILYEDNAPNWKVYIPPGEIVTVPRTFWLDDDFDETQSNDSACMNELAKFVMRGVFSSFDGDGDDFSNVTFQDYTGFDRLEISVFLNSFNIKLTDEPSLSLQNETPVESNASLAIVGVMLEMLVTGKDANGELFRTKSNTQANIVDIIEGYSNLYINRTGLSKTKANELFAAANKYLLEKRKL